MNDEEAGAATGPDRLRAEHAESVRADGPPAVPAWVKLLGVCLLVLIAVVVVAMLFGGGGPGGHGPRRHTGAAPW